MLPSGRRTSSFSGPMIWATRAGLPGNPQIPTRKSTRWRCGVRCSQVLTHRSVARRGGLDDGSLSNAVWHELNDRKQNKEPQSPAAGETTLADVLKTAGYATVCIASGTWRTRSFIRSGAGRFLFRLSARGIRFAPPHFPGLSRICESEPPYDDDNHLLRAARR